MRGRVLLVVVGASAGISGVVVASHSPHEPDAPRDHRPLLSLTHAVSTPDDQRWGAPRGSFTYLRVTDAKKRVRFASRFRQVDVATDYPLRDPGRYTLESYQRLCQTTCSRQDLGPPAYRCSRSFRVARDERVRVRIEQDFDEGCKVSLNRSAGPGPSGCDHSGGRVIARSVGAIVYERPEARFGQPAVYGCLLRRGKPVRLWPPKRDGYGPSVELAGRYVAVLPSVEGVTTTQIRVVDLRSGKLVRQIHSGSAEREIVEVMLRPSGALAWTIEDGTNGWQSHSEVHKADAGKPPRLLDDDLRHPEQFSLAATRSTPPVTRSTPPATIYWQSNGTSRSAQLR